MKVLICVGLMGLVVGGGLFWFVQKTAVLHADFDRCIATGTPLVGAIEAFREKKGRLPAGLDELVPEFMPALPRPADFGNCRRIIYQTFDEQGVPVTGPGGRSYRIDLDVSRLERVWYRSDGSYDEKRDSWGAGFEVRSGWAWTRD